jgi:hypothetical protein
MLFFLYCQPFSLCQQIQAACPPGWLPKRVLHFSHTPPHSRSRPLSGIRTLFSCSEATQRLTGAKVGLFYCHSSFWKRPSLLFIATQSLHRLLPPVFFLFVYKSWRLVRQDGYRHSPSLFAQAVSQLFQTVEWYPYPLFLLRGHTAAYRGQTRVWFCSYHSLPSFLC